MAKSNANAVSGRETETDTVFTTTEQVVADAWRRLEAAQKSDKAKDGLIQELIHRYDFVSQDHLRLTQELEQEKLLAKSLEPNFASIRKELENLRLIVDKEDHIVVLIDGDALVFNPYYLAQGDAGGQAAAEALRMSAQLFVADTMPGLSKDIKIIVRMYTNVMGMAEICLAAGLVPDAALLLDFMHGFTRKFSDCDAVDVGPRCDVSDKIAGLFEHYAHHLHCKHIILGCSYNDSYLPLLSKYTNDEHVKDRLSLLEAVPLPTELTKLHYRRTKFGTIFNTIALGNIQMAKTAVSWQSVISPPGFLPMSSGPGQIKHALTLSWASRAAAAAAFVPHVSVTPPGGRAGPLSASTSQRS